MPSGGLISDQKANAVEDRKRRLADLGPGLRAWKQEPCSAGYGTEVIIYYTNDLRGGAG